VICDFGKAEYFFIRGWTPNCRESPTGKSVGVARISAATRGYRAVSIS
jgi:hypothetical protein